MVGGGTKNSNHTRTLTARAIRTVDTKTKRLVNTIDLARQLATVQATPDAVWVSGVAVWRIEPLTGRVTTTFPIQSRPLAVGAGSVWVLGAGGAILRLDPSLGREQARIAGPPGAVALAFAGGSLWAGGSGVAPLSLLQIDPVSNHISSVTKLPGRYAANWSIASGFGSVWLCDRRESAVASRAQALISDAAVSILAAPRLPQTDLPRST